MSTVSVHRCRFVEYTPSAITAIAFPPLPLPPAKGKGKVADARVEFGILAVGRANGNIELHEWSGAEHQMQALQAWVLQRVLPAPLPSKVDNLVFTFRQNRPDHSHSLSRTAHLRLFSGGGGSEILEWNLEDGTILRSISSHAGSVWSMAPNPASTLLALGCEDGSVRVLSLADDAVTHYRRFDRVKARLLSIAWGPPVPRRSGTLTKSSDSSSEDENEFEWADTWVVVGCSDSSLRKYDVASGRVRDRMATDTRSGESTLVWAIGVLSDGTIVSGDSLGTVKFWDPTTCTQLQTFQTHNADVLCLAIGPEGRSVYTAGVDQKTCQFSHVRVSTASKGELSSASESRWVHSGSRRLHSHDVRALAVWPPHTPLAPKHWSTSPFATVAPLLVSGGLDMSLVVCPCSLPSDVSPAIRNPVNINPVSTFGDAYYLRASYSIGTSPAVQVAREAKLVLCRQDKGLRLWRINRSASPGDIGLVDLEMNESQQEGNDWGNVIDMELKVRTNLVASAISDDGQWVAACDLYETKLFRLVHTEGEVKPKRVRLSEENAAVATGVTSLLFTPDGSKLIMGASMGNALVVILDLAGEDNGSPRILRTFEHHRMRSVVAEADPERMAEETLDSEAGDTEPVNGLAESTFIRPRLRHQLEPCVSATITCMAASLDGQWLASADTQHRIHVFNLDSIQHRCALPSMPHAIAALAFDPIAPSMLVIGLANNTLQIFDVETRQFPSLYRSLPRRIAQLREPLLGIAFDPVPASGKDKDARRTLLWGSSWMCKVNLFARAPAGLGGSSLKKRRRESKRQAEEGPRQEEEAQGEDDESSSLRLVTRYRPVLLVDFVGPGEMVVVERPLVDLLSALPPAYFKPAYGS